jgi:very-short-patch-repair endonuclease
MNEEKRKEREKSFIEKVKIVHNGRYNYKEVYFINNHTKVSVICPMHGSFSILPKNHLRGQGCPICGKEKAKQCHKGNYDIFVFNLNKKFGKQFSVPNIKEEYVNEHSTITLQCNKCGKIYHIEPNYILSNQFSGCNDCNHKIDYEKLNSFSNTNNKIVPFDGFKDKRIDCVTMICPIHGEYKARIKSILKGKCQCKKCNGYKKLMGEVEFKERLYNKFGDTVKPISNYNGTNYNMTFQCNKGHIFARTPNTFFRGNLHLPCPVCSKEALAKEHTKTNEQFKVDVIKLYGKEKYDISNTIYVKSDKPITVKCNECGRYFIIVANSFLRGHGCPYHNCNSSIKEKEIKEAIENLGFDCLSNCRNVLPSGKEIDIYIPSEKIAIEFDGLYWHNELNKDKDYHLSKTIECEKLGIKLIHIFEDEWMHKKDAIVSFLKKLFGVSDVNIKAELCIVKSVDKIDSEKFLKENNIQGYKPSSIRYGLYYNDELISIMTFRKIKQNSNDYELINFCYKTNYNIYDASQKLFNHFISQYHPTCVISSIDRRFNNNDYLIDMGFQQFGTIKPTYYYVVGMERKNKTTFNKKTLIEVYSCPQNVTEHQFCLSKKWYRIYNCGSVLYKWTNNKIQ